MKVLLGSNLDQSEDSYIDENLSDVCRALMLDSGMRSSNNELSSQKEKQFSETFSFNKERMEEEKSVASVKSSPVGTVPSQEEVIMHEIEYEIMKNKNENFQMTMEFVKEDKPKAKADKSGVLKS